MDAMVTEFHEAYSNAYSSWGTALLEMKKDLDFTLGGKGQWSSADLAYLESERRNALSFNKMGRVLRLVGGYQRKNRLSMTCQPIEGSDEPTADIFSAILMFLMQYADGYNVLSDAFERGALITGINLVHLYLDYSRDMINGDIRLGRIPYNLCMIDPCFSKRDLSDCSYIMIRRCVTRETAKMLLPKHSKFIDNVKPQGLDSRFPNAKYYRDRKGEYRLRYDEYWKQGYDKVEVLVDMRTGQTKEYTGDKSRLKDIIQQLEYEGHQIKVIKRYKPNVTQHIIVEDNHIEGNKNPFGLSEYPFVPVMGFFHPEAEEMQYRIQGLARCMRDPQTEINKRRCKMLDIIDSAINTGWIARTGQVTNPKDLYGSGQGRVIYTASGTAVPISEQLRRIDPPQIPDGIFRLNELFDRDIMEIPGANSELMGMPESENLRVAGVLAKMRQGQGLTILQDIFDNYCLAKRLVGRKIIRLIQENYLPEKVFRITAKQPTQQFYTKDFGKYDVTLQEGVLSDTQRQMYYTQLINLKEQGIVDVPESAIIEAMPLAAKDKLKQAIAEQQKQRQAQMSKMEQQQDLTTKLLQAKTASDIAGAEEKRAQARENLANAQLDRLKALNQLREMDMNQVINGLKILIDLANAGLIPQQLPPMGRSSRGLGMPRNPVGQPTQAGQARGIPLQIPAMTVR